MGSSLVERKAKEELEKRYVSAEELLRDHDKVEEFLLRLELKFKEIPKIGDKLAHIPIMVSLVRSYIKKQYTDIPIGSIIAIIGALLYFVSPIDLIPDGIPGVGYFDDAAVVVVCWKFVEVDVDKYQKWRKENGKVVDI